MIMTNRRSIMGDKVNSATLNVVGWSTTVVIFAASVCLAFSYLHH
jgi:Mn2+/Fe2+ NRAMP family transporter